MLKYPNDKDYAELYHKLNPHKYIHSQEETESNWYEYNSYNVLISYGKNAPHSLLNNIADVIRPYILSKRNQLIPPLRKEYKSEEAFKDAATLYKTRRDLCDKSYQNLGQYVKGLGCIAYLKQCYTIHNIHQKFDNNQRVIAFMNMCYDFDTNTFRKIEPTDYITKTTRLMYTKERNTAVEKTIQDLLLTIFDKKELVDYYLTITGLSLFTNKFETLYTLTGRGANGKGLLSSWVAKAFGDYFSQAENTFLTKKKINDKNPTFAKAKGIRYLLITEPQENENDEWQLNIDFVKYITGRDVITCRELYKSTTSYTPLK